MRIAIVTETYPPEVNGVALTVRNFVHELSQLGHEIILTRPAPRGGPIEPMFNEHVRETFVASLPVPRYPGLRVGFPSGTRLRKLWGETRPHAVYVATEGPLGWSALDAARALDIPCATGFHTRFDEFVAHYGLPWLAPAALAMLRRFHAQGDATLVPTAELQQFLTHAGFANVRRLSRGVDAELFDPVRRSDALRAACGLGPDDLAVVHVGRVAAEKNLDLAARAFDAIKERRPDARMIWVGDGPQLAALRRARPSDCHVGTQRGTELAAYFASSDLFLFPSVTETFGNVTLESLASGVPVVAFDYGAARECIDEGVNGRVVPIGDAGAFVRAAVDLATDDAARRRVAALTRRSVLDRSQRAVAAELARLLESLTQLQWLAA